MPFKNKKQFLALMYNAPDVWRNWVHKYGPPPGMGSKKDWLSRNKSIKKKLMLEKDPKDSFLKSLADAVKNQGLIWAVEAGADLSNGLWKVSALPPIQGSFFQAHLVEGSNFYGPFFVTRHDGYVEKSIIHPPLREILRNKFWKSYVSPVALSNSMVFRMNKGLEVSETDYVRPMVTKISKFTNSGDTKVTETVGEKKEDKATKKKSQKSAKKARGNKKEEKGFSMPKDPEGSRAALAKKLEETDLDEIARTYLPGVESEDRNKAILALLKDWSHAPS